ncbi:MAG: DUF1569 domain-containing protein [Planctomycetaceae bacterium]|nr:DUF1569 domain-containing protein [Planctomycetaceae bacterium]
MWLYTKTKVAGHRRLQFQSLDEVLAEAEHLATVSTRQLGHWTLGQILVHLAAAYEKSLDGYDYRPGWPLRLLLRLVGPLGKQWVLRRGMPAGVRPPARIFQEIAPPDDATTEEGLRAFRAAIHRLQTEVRDEAKMFHIFTRDELDQFHMRHAELHLGYIVPIDESQSSPAGL